MDDNQITVLVKSCTIVINLDPFFAKATLPNQNKLFSYVFKEPWRNTEAITVLNGYLRSKQAKAKEDWDTASIMYQKNYKCTSFMYDLTEREKRVIENNNKKMLTAVKRLKSRYERWGKSIQKYEKMKSKVMN